MKKSQNPEWWLSKIAIASMVGTFLSILIMQRELNLTFAIWYLVVVLLVVVGNVIYVFSKRKRNEDIWKKTKS